MFIEMLSGLAVSLCYQNNSINFYATNNTGQQNISIALNLVLTAPFQQANYSQGIVQIISQNSDNSSNYISYYIWIAKNQFNSSLISQQLNLVSNNCAQFIFLQQSTNFSSQPCQIFGFTIQQQFGNFSIPVFYILNACISSRLSQIFGFQGNNYTNITVKYFVTQNWNIFSTLPPLQNQVNCIIQQGSTRLVIDDLIKSQFIVPYQQIAYKYYVLFNLTNGNITSFWQANSFYISSASQYQICQSLDGPLVNLEIFNDSSANICVYPNTIMTDDQIIYNIGCFQFNNFNQTLNRGCFGDYYLIIDESTQNTIAFQIQEQLKISFNVQGYSISSLTITASNQFGSSNQILNITNLDQYNIPDNNPPYDDLNSEQSHLGLILGVSFAILILFCGIVYLIIHYQKKKGQELLQQQLNQPIVEMR